MRVAALDAGFQPPSECETASYEDGTTGNACSRCDLLREHNALIRALRARREAAADRFAKLTPREVKIMEMVVAGEMSKNIAADLGISQRTVENHRAAIMKKTGSKSLAELGRLEFIAETADDGGDASMRDVFHKIVARWTGLPPIGG